MAKARKSKKRKAAKSKRSGKVKAKPVKKLVKKRSKAPRKAKPKPGPIDTVVGAVEEAAALRQRLAGHNTFED